MEATPVVSVRIAVRVSEVIVLAVLPGALLLYILFGGKDFSFDFHQFWQGGRDVVDGRSPYPTVSAVDAAPHDLSAHGIQQVFRFPYPAGSAVAMAPLALLSFHAAAVLLAILSVVAVALALWVLDVRDWRCYGVAFGSIPVITGLRLGTLTPLLLLAVALAWRYRDRRFVVSSSLAVAIVLKVFLWPLVFWLLATRRLAAGVLTATLAAVATLVAWAAIGFAGFGDYPTLVRRLVDVVGDRGFSLVALGRDVGIGTGASDLLPWLFGGAVLLCALLVAGRADGDRRAYALAVVASLLLSPIVWLHYFALLFAPIAVWQRSLSGSWLVPLLFWIVPFQETHGDAWRVALGLAITASAIGAAKWSGAPARVSSP